MRKAYVAQRDGDAYILAKDADMRFGTSRYVALYNGSDAEHELNILADALELGGGYGPCFWGANLRRRHKNGVKRCPDSRRCRVWVG